MNRKVLGVAMVVVFCITWWLVAGEAWQAANQAEQAYQQAEQAYGQQQAWQQAPQAVIMADAHFRTQGSWGIGAGLLADVLILIGVLAWQKMTFKP